MDLCSKLERMKDIIEDLKGEIQELHEMEEWKINFQTDVCMLVIQGALADDIKRRSEVVERMSKEITNNDVTIQILYSVKDCLFDYACRLHDENRRYEKRCSVLSDRLHNVDKNLCMYKRICEFLESSIIKEITDLRARIDGISSQLEGRLTLFEGRIEECNAKIRELSSVKKEKDLEAQKHAASMKSVKEEKNNKIQELLRKNKLQRNTVSSLAKMNGNLKNKTKDLETHNSDLEKKLTDQENNYTEQEKNYTEQITTLRQKKDQICADLKREVQKLRMDLRSERKMRHIATIVSFVMLCVFILTLFQGK